MEMVRRRKLCRNMLRLKPKKNKIRQTDKMDFENEEETHYNCTNDERKSHPYEGNINYVHVLADVLTSTHSLACRISLSLYGFSDSTDRTRTAKRLIKKYSDIKSVMLKLFMEVYYAEKKEILYEFQYDVEPHIISMMLKNKKEVVPCKSYRWNLQNLIEKATSCLRLSQSKFEKRIHRNKLVVFQAIKRSKECSLFE